PSFHPAAHVHRAENVEHDQGDYDHHGEDPGPEVGRPVRGVGRDDLLRFGLHPGLVVEPAVDADRRVRGVEFLGAVRAPWDVVLADDAERVRGLPGRVVVLVVDVPTFFLLLRRRFRFRGRGWRGFRGRGLGRWFAGGRNGEYLLAPLTPDPFTF